MKSVFILLTMTLGCVSHACPTRMHPPPIDASVMEAALNAIEEELGAVQRVIRVVDFRDCKFDPGKEPASAPRRLLWNVEIERARVRAGSIMVTYCMDSVEMRAFVVPDGESWTVRSSETTKSQPQDCG